MHVKRLQQKTNTYLYLFKGTESREMFDGLGLGKDDCNCKAYLKHSDLPCISIESRLKTQQAGFHVASTL